MAEGWGDRRGRRSNRNGGRYATRGRSFTFTGKRLSPLRLRSLGRMVEKAPCQRKCHLSALCRRHRRRFRARGRCQTLSCRHAAADGEVCTVVTSGQDSPDRIRTFCSRRSIETRSGKTGDLQLPRIHPHLWTLLARQIPASSEKPPRSDAYQAAGNQSGVATTDASDHSRAGEMATPSCNRLLCVPCGSNQYQEHKRISEPHSQPLATDA